MRVSFVLLSLAALCLSVPLFVSANDGVEMVNVEEFLETSAEINQQPPRDSHFVRHHHEHRERTPAQQARIDAAKMRFRAQSQVAAQMYAQSQAAMEAQTESQTEVATQAEAEMEAQVEAEKAGKEKKGGAPPKGGSAAKAGDAAKAAGKAAKSAGKAAGKAVKDAGKAAGKAVKAAGKAAGKAAKSAGKAAGKAAKAAGKAIAKVGKSAEKQGKKLLKDLGIDAGLDQADSTPIPVADDQIINNGVPSNNNPPQTDRSKDAATKVLTKRKNVLRSAQDVEDCVACRYIWLQVEMDVGNSQLEENIYDSFTHNCIEAQKAPIFYPACQDMFDAVDDMIGDYMDGFTVNQVCENARLCR